MGDEAEDWAVHPENEEEANSCARRLAEEKQKIRRFHPEKATYGRGTTVFSEKLQEPAAPPPFIRARTRNEDMAKALQ